jgi:hypothetical protein
MKTNKILGLKSSTLYPVFVTVQINLRKYSWQHHRVDEFRIMSCPIFTGRYFVTSANVTPAMALSGLQSHKKNIRERYLFVSFASRPTLGHSQPPIQWHKPEAALNSIYGSLSYFLFTPLCCRVYETGARIIS